MPQLWQIIRRWRFYEHRPDLRKPMICWRVCVSVKTSAAVKIASAYLAHSLCTAGALFDCSQGDLAPCLCQVKSDGELLRRLRQLSAVPSRWSSPTPRLRDLRFSMKLHFACLVDGLREDELGGEEALELRTPRRACCNLYDIISPSRARGMGRCHGGSSSSSTA